jgi:YggT family protein
MLKVTDLQSVEPVTHTDQAVQSTAGVERRERVVTDEAGLEHRERSVRDVAAEQRLRLLKVSQLVWLFVGIVEVLIGLRVLLKLIGANPANDFGSFVSNLAGVFLAPFFGLTGNLSSGAMVLEVPSLIAMVVYGLLGWLVVRALLPLFDRPTTSSKSIYDHFRG